jgi:hypothetical protein
VTEYETLVDKETRDFVSTCIENARKQMEREGKLSDFVYVGKFGATENFSFHLRSMPKITAAEMTKEAAKKVDADFIFYMDERWAIYPKNKAEASALRREFGRVENMPGAVRVVGFQIETHAGQFVGQVPRVTVDEAAKRYTFGAVEFELMRYVQGPFMGLLPPKGTTQ